MRSRLFSLMRGATCDTIFGPMTTDAQLQRFISDLHHPDKNVRIAAALEIGKRADAAALPALLTRLGDEPDFFVRESVTWAVVRIGHTAVLPLIALLERGDDAAKFNAAHTLSKLADARAVPALLAALDDSSPALVQKAIYALGRIGDMRALPALLARVGIGARETRTSTNEALEAFGAAAVPCLVETLHTGLTEARVDVAEILGAIGDSAAIDALVRALNNEATAVRFAIVNALRHSADPVSIAALERAREDVHAHVRLLAAHVLAGLREPKPRRAAASKG